MTAAYRSASKSFRHEQILLKAADYSTFFAAFDNPPPASERLKASFDRHDATVVSKQAERVPIEPLEGYGFLANVAHGPDRGTFRKMIS